jgi:hypothetical protein
VIRAFMDKHYLHFNAQDGRLARAYEHLDAGGRML